MGNQELSTALQSRLQLSYPPVALAFVGQQPGGVSRTQTLAPSPCGFWRQAEKGVFYAAAEDHFNCPVGSYVMGFELPEQQMQKLMEEIGFMGASTYVKEAEVPNIPKVGVPSAGIVYGPLSQFPQDPDAVLLWVTPQQSMVLNEALGKIDWSAQPQTVFGRPGCAAVPYAMQGNTAALSLGCTGMRQNTEIPGEYFLMTVSKAQLASLEEKLFAITELHQGVKDYYRQRAAKSSSVRS